MELNFAKEIDIAEPIWKDRSVGLAVDDVPLGQIVKVTISYKRKGTGELSFPGDFYMNVDEIRKYPLGTVGRGIRVHYVPIKDLTKATLFSNNQNQSNMLFSSQDLGKIIKESEEAKANAGNYDSKKTVEPGKHLMTITDVVLQNAKSDGNPMVVVEFTKDDEHRPIKNYMKIAGPNTDISREQLVKLFHRGFGYSIQPCKTDKDLMDQLLKFKGKQLSVAVKGQKQAYAFEKDGKDIVMETIKPEYWYCASTSEFDEFYIDVTKMVSDLSQEDKEKLIRFAEINGGPYVPKEKAPASEATAAPVQQQTPTINPISNDMTIVTNADAGNAAPQSTSEKLQAQPIEVVEAQPEVSDSAPIQESVAPAPQAEQAQAPGDDFPF